VGGRFLFPKLSDSGVELSSKVLAIWYNKALYDTIHEEVEMASYCRLCGKQIEEGEDICEACKENIRAEALGKHRKVAKQIPQEGGKLGKHHRKEIEDNQSLPIPQDEEDKKPHHFKSMAEYLKYLKGKGGN
jgi:predicted nucleic acid-binding Zn ribbon protein